MRAIALLQFILLFASLVTAAAEPIRVYSALEGEIVLSEKVVKSDEEWRRTLTEEQFHILREKGTERAYSGALHDNHEHGIYRCAACGLDLFRSEHKYDSGTGWPSFYEPISPLNIRFVEDRSFFLRRTEVVCARCGSHLGHVFDDGPGQTGKRYCMNSAAMEFVALKSLVP